ncbi:response regulator transcription factor [Cohnella sp. REN36]|uniref:response regulator transcription factor n=1 Tax=Cohnella sp. REN36 TaxID=2887347 RepID=UPI001D146640|nr:response regulator transcription factor [Cohnella sp. REN36]MCC3373564.1 response regulator transcription factor [Cohnella sp. REN36]
MKRILIIEDEDIIAEVEKDYFEASGFSVEIAQSGDIGLQKAIHEEYDLIILDLLLPETDGFEICKQVRKSKNIPVLIVSSKIEEIDKIRGFGLGADDYVTKPFNMGELVARVKAHLARYERLTQSDVPQKDEIRTEAIHIDKRSRQVFVNGTEAFLTSKEYDLLLFLMQNPNHVFSKDELFMKIWGMDSLGDIATVTVHISRLREKIEPDPSNPQYIETVWGVGYRLKV